MSRKNNISLDREKSVGELHRLLGDRAAHEFEAAVDREKSGMHKAMLWDPLTGNAVQCALCSHRCRIEDGKKGICRVRENQGGILYTLVYDRVIARHVDPVEKKPLYHFLPGSRSYSIGTPGCNFRCLHCQNADIAQMPRETEQLAGEAHSPESIVDQAVRSGCRSIAYTYTEPTIFFELAYDTAKLARARGLKNVFVSNGYFTEEALNRIRPWLDAANIDLKAGSKDFYRRVCGARLDRVLESIRRSHEAGIWVEITTLVIPHRNDSRDELRDIARFIAGIDRGIPWHVSRFYPTFKMTDEPPTPVETVNMARETGLAEGLEYVYTGNVPDRLGRDTFCPACGGLVIQRGNGYAPAVKLAAGRCVQCGAGIAGVFE